MILETIAVGALQCNCSILGDEASREAIVVDPGDDIPRIMAILARHGLTLKQIVVTHAHIDHIAGAQRLKRLTGAPVLYNANDLPLVKMMDVQAGWLGMATPEVEAPDDALVDGRGGCRRRGRGGCGAGGKRFCLRRGIRRGSVCLYVAKAGLLLAGDTLFAGSVGRTDLPGGDMPTLMRSIHGKLLVLPEETVVVPGHGPRTTIAEEKATNPFLV